MLNLPLLLLAISLQTVLLFRHDKRCAVLGQRRISKPICWAWR
jgi:uncharacterized membrane protein YsdA (DUF1294 family)